MKKKFKVFLFSSIAVFSFSLIIVFVFFTSILDHNNYLRTYLISSVDNFKTIKNAEINLSDMFGATPAFLILGEGNDRRNYEKAREVGIKHTRLDINWFNIEAEKNNWLWRGLGEQPDSFLDSRPDVDIENLQELGMNVSLGNLNLYPPQWTRCKNEKCNCTDPACISQKSPTGCYPENIEELKSFVRKVVERYDGDGFEDMPGLKKDNGIKTWRFGNELGTFEVEGSWGWCGTKEDFLNTYYLVYDAIKEADKNAEIVMGGVHDAILACFAEDEEACNYIQIDSKAKDSYDMFDYIYKNIDKNKVNGFGLHPYYKIDLEGKIIDGFKKYLIKTRGNKFFRKVYFVVDEDGHNVQYTSQQERDNQAKLDKEQSIEIVKRAVLAISRGVKQWSWFDFYFYHGDGIEKPFNNMALLRYDGNISNIEGEKYMKRPGFFTYQLMTGLLSNSDINKIKIIKEDDATYNRYDFLFNDRNKIVSVLWSNKEDGFSYKLPKLKNDIVIKNIITECENNDCFNNPPVFKEIYIKKGENYILNLTREPVFIENEKN